MSTPNRQTTLKILPNELIVKELAKNIREGHSVSFTIRGNSMNPFLKDGRDQVTLSPFRKDDLRSGAVILAREMRGRYLLHRIITREGDKITMSGDGNTGLVEETSIDNVVGVLTKVFRKGVCYQCDGIVWKSYSVCWMRLTPLRRVLLRVIRRISLHCL